MAPVFLYFAALYTAIMLVMVGSGLHGTLLSVRLTAEGMSPQVTGWVMAGFYAGMIAGTFVCPAVIRRAGHARAFAFFAAVNTAVILTHALTVSPAAWWFLRVLTGLAMMGVYMVIESWLVERTGPDMRGKVFSVYMVVTFLGLGAGQFLLTAAPPGSQDKFILVGILYALGLIPVVITRTEDPAILEHMRINLLRRILTAPLGMAVAGFAGAMAASLYILGPIFVLRAGLPLSRVASFMGTVIISGLVLQWPVGSVSDRYDRRHVLALLGAAVAALALLVSVAMGAKALILPAAAAFGGVVFTIYPVAVAHANDFIPPGDRVAGSATLILCYGCGAFLGPLLAAGFMELAGPGGLFFFFAVCGGMIAAISLVASTRASGAPGEPVSAIPVPRTSPVIAEIDPRLEDDAPPAPGGNAGMP